MESTRQLDLLLLLLRVVTYVVVIVGLRGGQTESPVRVTLVAAGNCV